MKKLFSKIKSLFKKEEPLCGDENCKDPTEFSDQEKINLHLNSFNHDNIHSKKLSRQLMLSQIKNREELLNKGNDNEE